MHHGVILEEQYIIIFFPGSMVLHVIWKLIGWMQGIFVGDIVWMLLALKHQQKMISLNKDQLVEELDTFGAQEGNVISEDVIDPVKYLFLLVVSNLVCVLVSCCYCGGQGQMVG